MDALSEILKSLEVRHTAVGTMAAERTLGFAAGALRCSRRRHRAMLNIASHARTKSVRDRSFLSMNARHQAAREALLVKGSKHETVLD